MNEQYCFVRVEGLG